MATVRMSKSNVKGVWVEGEVYHLWKYRYGAESISLGSGSVCRFQFANESLFFYQSICAVREVSFQYNAFKVRD